MGGLLEGRGRGCADLRHLSRDLAVGPQQNAMLELREYTSVFRCDLSCIKHLGSRTPLPLAPTHAHARAETTWIFCEAREIKGVSVKTLSSHKGCEANSTGRWPLISLVQVKALMTRNTSEGLKKYPVVAYSSQC